MHIMLHLLVTYLYLVFRRQLVSRVRIFPLKDRPGKMLSEPHFFLNSHGKPPGDLTFIFTVVQSAFPESRRTMRIMED